MKLSRMTGIFINWRVREWHFQIGRYWPHIHLSMNPYWREIVRNDQGEAVPRYKLGPLVVFYRTLMLEGVSPSYYSAPLVHRPTTRAAKAPS